MHVGTLPSRAPAAYGGIGNMDMKIAVVGVGALGSVYALRLSHVAQVVLVVRDLDRAPQILHGERASGPAPHGDALTSPPTALSVPEDSEVVLVAVRVEQLDDALLDALARGGPSDRIVVVLAPLLPPRYQRVRAKLGDRLVAAMPGVVAYEPDPDPTPKERRVRYWTPKVAPTVLEDRAEGDPRRAKVRAFAEVLRSAGLPADVSASVRATNAATTIAFFPILTGIAAGGGSIERMLEDDALMKLGLAATKEAKALAKRVGDLPSWASLFLSFASQFTVRAGIKLGRAKSPESISFLEKHYGSKLSTQNQVMLDDLRTLAREQGVRIEAIEALSRRAGLS